MKYNLVFIYETYTYDMNNYDIKYKCKTFYVMIKYENFTLAFPVSNI